jgi:molybdopterin-guanine dinucleotide biosynthesis adapter protein
MAHRLVAAAHASPEPASKNDTGNWRMIAHVHEIAQARGFASTALSGERHGKIEGNFADEDGWMKVIGLAGWSGAGKTTLLTRLIPHLIGEGLRVSTIKHAHHGFDLDKPGKDSWAHREAGASEVLVASGRRWALMHELRGANEPTVGELLAKLSPVDFVIVESFKASPIRKIEIHRAANGKSLLHPGDPSIVAIATDVTLETPLPVVSLDDIAAIAGLVQRFAMPIEMAIAARGAETSLG